MAASSAVSPEEPFLGFFFFALLPGRKKCALWPARDCWSRRALEPIHAAGSGGLLHGRCWQRPSTEAVEEFHTLSVRGALLAKGPDSSFGEVHRGSCSEPIHMEEEVEDGRDK